MSTAAVVPPPPDAAPQSEGQRIINTFIAPSKAFSGMEKAHWWVPWIVISIFSVIFAYAVDRQIGFEQIAKTNIARSSRADQFDKLPADQQARQLAISAKITRIATYCSPILVLIIFLIDALVLMAAFNFGTGSSIPFGRVFAIVNYGSLPGLIGGILGLVSLFAGVDPEGFNINNPSATNPAYFMNPMGPKFVYIMASALDVFVIWNIIAMGIGFSMNSKAKRGTAIGVVAGCYIVYKLIGAGLASAF